MSLVLGPVLRHVGRHDRRRVGATGRPATVSRAGLLRPHVRGRGAPLRARAPSPASSRTRPTPTRSRSTARWSGPRRVSPLPPSTLRTRGPASAAAAPDRLRLVPLREGRQPQARDPPGHRRARRLRRADRAAAPRGVARRAAPARRPGLRRRADAAEPAPHRRATRPARRTGRTTRSSGFDEYVGLYHDSWSDPEVRWLLSCVPTAMIFDDHDVRDDWNTSAVWRGEMAEKPWWRERIRSALASYWVYQHLGNLPPEELAADPDYREVMAAEGDTWPLLVALADRADAETDGTQGSALQLPLGPRHQPLRDDRLPERPDPGRRRAPHARRDRVPAGSRSRCATGRPGDVDHLVLGTSLPWLLPHAIGDLQSINQIAAARPGWRGRLGRDDPAGRRPGALAGVPLVVRPAHADGHCGRDRRRTRRSSISVLSGDVHHSYAAAGRPAGPRRRPGSRCCRRPPAHLLAGAQRRRLVHPARVPPRLVAHDRAGDPLVGSPGRGAAARGELAPARGPAVRQHGRHAGSGRATRRGHVPAAAVGGHGDARPPGWC